MYGSTESTDQFESEFTESTSSNDRPFCPTPPPPYEERRVFNIGSWEFDLLWTNLLFAFVVVVGDVGQDISLHLYWLSSSKESTKSCQVIDSYFVLSFGSLSSFVIFGLGALFIRIVFPRHLGENEKSFPQFSLSLIGLCSALNEALAVFAISTTRTPLYLQIILGTLTIPLTVLFRWVKCFRTTAATRGYYQQIIALDQASKSGVRILIIDSWLSNSGRTRWSFLVIELFFFS